MPSSTSNHARELNKGILKVFDYKVESSQSLDNSLDEFEKDFGQMSLAFLQCFISNCTINEFERLKIIASNFEVSTNF